MVQKWRSAAAARASNASFGDLFEEGFERVARSVLLVLGDRESARDITQEAFVKALVHWRRIGHYDEPVGWVRKVAIRMALRHRHRESRFEQLQEVDDAGLERDSATASVDPAILQALDSLSRMQRAALALRYLDDLSVSTIAETLGCSEPTVRVHLHRGRQRLHETLVEEHNDVH